MYSTLTNSTFSSLLKLMTGACLLLYCTAATASEPLAPPAGEVLLAIKGAIDFPNVEGEVHLDRAALEAMPSITYETNTPWSDGIQSFTGVRLNVLFDLIGAQTDTFVAVGLDDYKFTFQDIDIEKYPVMIAYLHNGKPMSVRQLGPLRIMFPFDEYPELLTPKNESSSVWQLLEIELL